jgi:DNA-binding NarL/FixJ family response regulator
LTQDTPTTETDPGETQAPPQVAVTRPRVLIAEDHTLVREGLRILLSGEVEVVDTVEDGRALLSAAERLKPDVILLDISMPLLNGLDAARQLAQAKSTAKLVFVTMHADPAYVRQAFRAGASGYVVKSSASAHLTEAIHEVVAGRRYISPIPGTDVADLLTGDPSSEGGELSDNLTPRQREILQLVAEGRTAREIAGVLGISRKTVEFHKASIMRLLRLRTTAELTRYAMAHGIIASA